jgi:hypothetical protein
VPTAFLFPADPLRPRMVDEHFAGQAAVVREAGGQVALIDHDALVQGRTEASVRRVPPTLGPAWYRGWMIGSDRYATLADAGVDLITTPGEYRRAHEFPGWYTDFADVTPASVWTSDVDADLAELVAPLGDGPGIVKDFVKSRKHEWDEACYIPDLTDTPALTRVVRTFVERQAESLAGGIVLRAFEQFDRGEARVWWLDGKPILVSPHPDTPDVNPDPDLSVVPSGALPRFATTDLARRSDGEWRVIEVGDGQVSDLPTSLDPASLIGLLLRSGNGSNRP